jgi:PAS domain S-box-containing protein
MKKRSTRKREPSRRPPTHNGLFGYPGGGARAHQALDSALSMRDQRLRFIAEALPQIVWTAEPDGYQDFFNHRWFSFTGLTEEETYSGLSALHPDDFPRYVKRWKQALRIGHTYEAEYRIRRRDGTYRWFLVRGLPIKDAQGRVVKWFGTFTDIHDMKEIEQTLRESEGRYRALVDMAPDGIVVHRNNRFLYANKAALHLIRARSFKQLAALPVLSLVVQQDRRASAARMRSVFHKHVSSRAEVRIRSLDGKERMLEARATHIEYEGSAAIQLMLHDITERKQREQEMERFASFTARNPNPIIEVDFAGKILFYNPAAARIFPQLKKRGLHHPWLAGYLGIVARFRKGEFKNYVREMQYGERWFQQTLWLYSPSQCIRIYGQDISLRKRRVAELEKMNRTLRALSRSSQALVRVEDEKKFLREICTIVVKDCEHALVWVGYAEQDRNKSVRPVAYAGFDSSYIKSLNITWSDTVRGRGPTGIAIRSGRTAICKDMKTDARFSPWRRAALRRGYRSSVALPLRSGGHTFGALTIYSREADAFSKEELTLLSTLADDLGYGITAIRLRRAHAKAEAALRASEEQLRTLNADLERMVVERTEELEVAHTKDRANLRRFKDMINTMSVGVVATDEHLRVIHVNSLYCDYFGLPSPDHIIGMHGPDVVRRMKEKFLHPDQANVLLMHAKERQLASGLEVPLKDGRVLLRDSLPVYDGDAFRGMMFAYRDITKEKRIDAAKSDFMSFASHQLRTPLTAIRWALGRMRRDLDPSSQTYQLTDAAFRAAKNMAETINTMLSISRIEGGIVSLSVSEFPLRKIMKEVTDLVAEERRRRKQRLHLRCPQKLAIGTDAKLFKEVLLNLVTNAIKYSPENASVRICASQSSEGVRIEVEDEGFGIPADEQDKIFGKFYRGANAVRALTEGSGLGLYLVSLLVSTLQGKISFVSREGKGSTFTLILPASLTVGS